MKPNVVCPTYDAHDSRPAERGYVHGGNQASTFVDIKHLGLDTS